MYLRENPVLQRELLVNLRKHRSFVLLAIYQIVLASIVWIAWPQDLMMDLTTNPPSAKKLANLFFLGQYVIASLMAPSFAAGAVTGEKERSTYEMLLASPLRPGAIILGKIIASLTHLILFVVASVPIMVLCLPLGGLSVYEVLAAYLGLLISIILFGSISIFCSSYFSKTSHSLVVSYLVILPLVLGAIFLWQSLEQDGALRLKLIVLVLPPIAFSFVAIMGTASAKRMSYPPDLGSEGHEVIDIDRESEQAVGLVIQSDQFPDRLFAPPRKRDLMPDGCNPVYDKELHGEIFSQGTLMLRLAIQISMLLAIPMMGIFLFWKIESCVWFPIYVIVFNLLVGPVFLAGSMTSERERQTLGLLLTTNLTPWQILFGKFVVGFRVAGVLTSFLVWPFLLGVALNMSFWSNWLAVIQMLAVMVLVCLANSVLALLASLFSSRTSISLIGTYAALLVLYVLPPATSYVTRLLGFADSTVAFVDVFGFFSPFSALFAIPLDENLKYVYDENPANIGDPSIVIGYLCFTVLFIALAILLMVVRLRSRKGLAI
ncbi:MAG: ABC transporter permease [Planctomycetota bacterium]|nr:ABC transporter permease [Planctomycetota bacterium]